MHSISNTREKMAYMFKRNLDLLDGERLIGSETVAMHKKILIFRSLDTDKLFVTDQRVCFPFGSTPFSYRLDEILHFKNGMLGATTLVTKGGKQHTFTTSSAKKVKEWLREAGIDEV